MKIYCENQFCIYYENGMCALDYVSLDDSGICEQVLSVDIEEEVLYSQRKKLLEKFKQLNEQII